MLPPAKPSWRKDLGLRPVLEGWLASQYVKPCLTADAELPGRLATHAPFPELLPKALRSALELRGIRELYTHQARAFEIVKSGKSFVVATPTASGKSLCFHLPVLSTMIEDEGARALYLFPTKALARDQETGLRELMRDTGLTRSAVVFDGDTPGDARRAARERGGIIITNPDMLHSGILPHHAAWARTFQSLRYVIVDELHTYRGVFGSHVAHVIERLRRIARFHGSDPIFLGATATIGNPQAHAAELFGASDVALLDESGAPAGKRRFFTFNPPVVNAELGVRASYVKQAVFLASDLVRAEVPTIVFGHSRNNVEVMLRYLRENVPEHRDRIQGYRGGYLPEKRREIETRLKGGEILCVVATNALELGIDIGDLDAVICAGFPGSIAAMWQRFGRAGRRSEGSIAVLVASSAPLDQFLARESSYLLGAPMEHARIDPKNPEILIQHLKCAAFELPFRRGDSYGRMPVEETTEALEFLAGHQVLHESKNAFHWASDVYPANHVSLRSVGWDNVVIIDAANDKTLAEIDWRGAHTMVHEQAIYQHDGECYQVERFDHENHKAFVRNVAPDYFTEAMTHVTIAILEEQQQEAWATIAHASSGVGEVSLVEKVVGYKKIKFFTHENAGYGDVRLPDMQIHTMAYWLTLREDYCAGLVGGRSAAVDALRGIGGALETVATWTLMCDPRDLGVTLGDTGKEPHAEAEDAKAFVPRKTPGARGYNPTLFIYEHTPGGTGLVTRIYEHRNELMRLAKELIMGCPCADGCPACVGPSEGRKTLSLRILEDLVRDDTRASLAGQECVSTRAAQH
jgi:DEAD/DEAH box helicase domain-containing protein